ncbi:class 1 fructose-bisphosphatase [Pleomorphomonas diazotrophica]|uniref:Fructose-1,6-bisphosphatase class 1 n=1 Tax=Pleomorphomonas diazotrophica TaxID=1166257 RepID=A0A1I4VSP3_9HYPH|nr:class 1 fructose-bisphosphatase [Pleomorphomonas diazotrophica]PKR89323.1 class 1 fructose-bisphosphatase [Pleomorphomonas diazotrophica]SFN04180.1 D-fructose 1,6-bisphosphatase [Pleomorphomonas diazotrophica]
MTYRRITLPLFLVQEQRRLGGSGVFTALMTDICTTCKTISNEVNRGAMAGTMGYAGSRNVQGEEQKELDVLANDIFLYMTDQSGNWAGVASEELEDAYISRGSDGRYLLLFDPLDGSSNIGVNVAVGSIFSILRLPEGADPADERVYLQPGVRQVAAGYTIYGASTMLVLTSGQGVNGFTLDRNIGVFVLTHPNMQIPEDTGEYAINASRERHWPAPIHRYVRECVAGLDGPRGRSFNTRWIASMVAEVHRILMRGGVFMYPVDRDNAPRGGHLRLLYEANPMAFIVEQAGGRAISGHERILDIVPERLHQRTGVILGSRNEVERIGRYYAEAEPEKLPVA